ncbi:T9SS type A sorting domain-containing protein [Algibacter pacificus]|uniref:T9SS type A sorting domain-containing protein n=1 Tax=Algibacter pacificus TaxID=2599389 RepID=UPI0011C8E4B0|nr:T9SS type A sorting domain-containing protein [Algibacter pacificus]
MASLNKTIKVNALLLFLFIGPIGFSQKIIYSEDFESGSDWTLSSNDATIGAWNLDDNGAGSSSGADGNYLFSKQYTSNNRYNNNTYITTTSPIIDITGVVELIFQFDLWYKTGNHNDGMQIQYSYNGSDWNVLGDNSTAWNDNLDYKSSIGALGSDGWSGTSNGWLTRSIRFDTGNTGNSTPDIHSQIQFRVVFASTHYSSPPNDSGVAFDNVVVKLEYEDPIEINQEYNSTILYISDVSLAGNPNIASADGATGAYVDHTEEGTSIDLGSLGDTLEGTIEVTVNGWNTNTNYLHIWIDFDQNYYFSTVEHFSIPVKHSFWTGPNTKTIEVTLSDINIPADAIGGNTRIRIGFADGNANSVTATDYNYKTGEVEDFNVNIIDPCATYAWTGATSEDWNTNENWACGEVPTIDTNVLIPEVATGHYYPTIATGSNGFAKDITIATEATVTIESNYLEIAGELLLNGLIDLNNEAQLIQLDGSTLNSNSMGSIEIDQQGTANTYSYNYWGSPVGTSNITNTNAYSYTLEDVLYQGDTKAHWTSGLNGSTTPLTISTEWINKYANGNGNYASWQHVGSTGLIEPGEGFSMKGPSTSLDVNTLQNYTFKGKPNNGDINLNISAYNYYLVANPYPSAIDGYQFIQDNVGNLATGTLYFWQQFKGTSHVLAEYEGDYAILTLSGGTMAQTNTDEGTPAVIEYNKKEPAKYIPVGQGFFVQSMNDTDGIIKFKNSQRAFVKQSDLDNGNPASVFLKTSNSKKTTINEKYLDLRPKIRLNFEVSRIGFNRELLLTVDEHSTDGIDWGYDGKSFGIGKYDLFWNLNDDDYVIQAIPDINDNREIPLGLEMGTAGLAIIKIGALENIDSTKKIYLKDALSGETQQINDDPFEIELPAGTYLDRFSIVFSPSETLHTDQNILEEDLQVFVNNKVSEIEIRNNNHTPLKEINLYNNLGQLVNTWRTNLDGNFITLPVNNQVTGVYILKINTSSNTLTKKLIIQ